MLVLICLLLQVLEVGNGEFDCSTPESIDRAKAHFGMWWVQSARANPIQACALRGACLICCAAVGSLKARTPLHSIRCLMKSPLLLGTDMTFHANPHLEKTILGIVGNRRVLSINQDSLGVQARRVMSAPGPPVTAGAVTNADVTLVIAACNASRPTQTWRHNASEPGVGPLWTEDAEGTRWCTTSIAAGQWNVFQCDGVNSSTVCQGATGATCRDHITICDDQASDSRSHSCNPVDRSIPGRKNVSIMNWQGLHANFGCGEFGSGPVPHSCYLTNGGPEAFTFDASAKGGSPISPHPGSMIIDDDAVGSSHTVGGSRFCLDVALGGNLEAWTAPLSGGRHAVGLLNRSPSKAKIAASWEALGLASGEQFDAIDAWTGDAVGSTLSGEVAVETASRALTLLILSPAASGVS